MNREQILENKLEWLQSHKKDCDMLLEMIEREIKVTQYELDNERINRDPVLGDSDFEDEQ